MTTGRINQVTIVCRGWPPARIAAPERFTSYWWRPKPRRSSAVGRGLQRLRGNPLSPSKFPRASVRRTEPAVGGVAWGPQEEGTARRFYHCGVRAERLPPDALVSGLASGQSSTEPIRQRRGRALSAVARQPQYGVMPGHSLSWGSTATMSPPLARPEPASLFRGSRSGSLQDQVQLFRSAFRGHLEGIGCAAAFSVPFGPGCFAPFSYTLRDRSSGPHARPGSWATFYFPQNSFVWENKKIDSRPPKRKTKLHALLTQLPYTLN